MWVNFLSHIPFIIFFYRRILKEANDTENININCVDPLGRSALLMAIDNENLEMVELLILYNVDTKDALLHAISEEFVEAVEMLLDHEDGNSHKEGQHVSWKQIMIKIRNHSIHECRQTAMWNVKRKL